MVAIAQGQPTSSHGRVCGRRANYAEHRRNANSPNHILVAPFALITAFLTVWLNSLLPWMDHKFGLPGEALRLRSTVELTAKIPILGALRLIRHARGFESGHGVVKGLLISTKPSTPAVVLRDDAAADKTLP
jgi:hypothetical protein